LNVWVSVRSYKIERCREGQGGEGREGGSEAGRGRETRKRSGRRTRRDQHRRALTNTDDRNNQAFKPVNRGNSSTSITDVCVREIVSACERKRERVCERDRARETERGGERERPWRASRGKRVLMAAGQAWTRWRRRRTSRYR
jgi:hypothetical protein